MLFFVVNSRHRRRISSSSFSHLRRGWLPPREGTQLAHLKARGDEALEARDAELRDLTARLQTALAESRGHRQRSDEAVAQAADKDAPGGGG